MALNVRDHNYIRTAHRNTLIKFGVSSTSVTLSTGLIDLSVAHRQTDRHTSNEISISAIYSVHLTEIKMLRTCLSLSGVFKLCTNIVQLDLHLLFLLLGPAFHETEQ